MTTTRRYFSFRTLLGVFGAAIQHRMRELPHYLKERRGGSAKGPWARHRGSYQHPPRRAAARGPGSIGEHDLLVRNFGRRNTDRHLYNRSGTWPSGAMDDFLRVFRETGSEDAAREAAELA